MDDLLLGALGSRLDSGRGRRKRTDLFEWNTERAQEQILSAVGRDAASRWEARRKRRGERGGRIRPASPRRLPFPSSPSKKLRNPQSSLDEPEVRDAVDPDGERPDEVEDALAGRGVEVGSHRSMIGLDGIIGT